MARRRVTSGRRRYVLDRFIGFVPGGAAVFLRRRVYADDLDTTSATSDPLSWPEDPEPDYEFSRRR